MDQVGETNGYGNMELDEIVDVMNGEHYQGFDRFPDLPYIIKCKIINMLDKKSLLVSCCTSWELNQIASPLITRNFMLAIKLNTFKHHDNKPMADMFLTILKNALICGRKYNKIGMNEIGCAINTDFRSFVFYALSVVGDSVKELSIKDSNISYAPGIKLLGCFLNVTKLELKHVYVGDHLMEETDRDETFTFPNLKDLTIICSCPQTLRWFLHCRNLEAFEFELDLRIYFNFNTEFDIMKFENFLIAQDNLKRLVLSYLLSLDMFQYDRSADVKFQLESLILLETYFTNHANALSFFRTQKSLINIETWIDNSDPDFYNSSLDMLKLIYSTPTLLKVTTNVIDNDLDFNTNPSVKYLEFSDHVWPYIISKMKNIFPNLDEILLNSPMLTLINFRCEDLRLIKSNEQLYFFKYQPEEFGADGRTFEVMVKCFLIRNAKIKSLIIGNSNWLERGIGLSLKFCMDLMKILPDLNELELYNPLQIKNLVMFLLCSRRNFNSITLYTNEAGNGSIKRMHKEGLNIVFV